MKLRFMGSTGCIPDLNEDCPSFLLNDTVLFDCGWHVTDGLRQSGRDVSRVRTLFFTHMHHDHYLGLASLLFYLAQARVYPWEELTVCGPKEQVGQIVEEACRFITLDRFFLEQKRPRIVGLEPGDTAEVEGISVSCARAGHPVPGLCYRLKEKETGTVLCTGFDTAPVEELIPFFEGCDVLIHEATLGPIEMKDDPRTRACGHSSFFEAEAVARAAGAKTLFPVHMSKKTAEAALQQAKGDVRVLLPEYLKEFTLSKEGAQ